MEEGVGGRVPLDPFVQRPAAANELEVQRKGKKEKRNKFPNLHRLRTARQGDQELEDMNIKMLRMSVPGEPGQVLSTKLLTGSF